MTTPLHGALDDAENTPEARGYQVPLDRVRQRVRRRRAARRGGVAGAAVLGVSALVVVLPLAGRGELVTPPVGEGDWPGQVERCGQPIEDVLGDEGPAELALEDPDRSIAAGAAWTTLALAYDPAEQATTGWVYGTDVSFVQDGVVIAVQSGEQVPALADVDEYFAGADFAPEPLPLVTALDVDTIACDEYLDGAEPHGLLPGEYEVFVTQTVGMAGADGEEIRSRTSISAPLTVTADGVVPGDEPTGIEAPGLCGRSAEFLEEMADPELNPAPLKLTPLLEAPPGDSGLAPSVPAAGSDYRFYFTLENTGTEPIQGIGGLPHAYVVRDGLVVGMPADVRVSGSTVAEPAVGVSYDLEPGEKEVHGVHIQLIHCSVSENGVESADEDLPLEAGRYDLWVSLSINPELAGSGPAYSAAGVAHGLTVVASATPTRE